MVPRPFERLITISSVMALCCPGPAYAASLIRRVTSFTAPNYSNARAAATTPRIDVSFALPGAGVGLPGRLLPARELVAPAATALPAAVAAPVPGPEPQTAVAQLQGFDSQPRDFVPAEKDGAVFQLRGLFDGGTHQLPATIPNRPMATVDAAVAVAFRDDLIGRSRIRLKEARREIELYRAKKDTGSLDSARALEASATTLANAIMKADYVEADGAYRRLGEKLSPDDFHRSHGHDVGAVAGVALVTVFGTLIGVLVTGPLAAAVPVVAVRYLLRGAPWNATYRPLPLSRQDARQIRSLVPDFPALTSRFTERRRSTTKALARHNASTGDVMALKLLVQREHDPSVAQAARQGLKDIGTKESKRALAELKREEADRARILSHAPPVRTFDRLGSLRRSIGGFFKALQAPAPIVALPDMSSVRTLAGYLARERANLPRPAAERLDVIARQLQALESHFFHRSAPAREVEALNRLSKHILGLIESYMASPVAARDRREGQEATPNEKLLWALDIIKLEADALEKPLGDDFKIQVHFIEHRYGPGPI